MSVTKLWWVSLGLTSVVVAVVATLLLQIIAAARSIDRHAEGIWTVGKQIAGNTVSIWMLGKTNEQLARILDATRGLERATAALDEKVRALTGAGSQR